MRGLKYGQSIRGTAQPVVAPFTGAWIEIGAVDGLTSDTLVAPFTGAWIEI